MKILILTWLAVGLLPACWLAQKSLVSKLNPPYDKLSNSGKGWKEAGWIVSEERYVEYKILGCAIPIKFFAKKWIPIVILISAAVIFILTWSLLPSDQSMFLGSPRGIIPES